MINANNTNENAAAGADPTAASGPNLPQKGTPPELYTGMVIPIKTMKRKDGITMNRTQMEIEIAKEYLKMNDEQKALLLRIMDLITGRPDRREMAMSWTGPMKDLPAALAQI